MRKLLTWLLILVLAISLAGCGSSKSGSNSAAMEDREVSVQFSKAMSNGEADRGEGYGVAAEPSTAATEVKTTMSTDQTTKDNVNSNQKIIFTGQVDFQTLEFDKTRNELCNYMSSIGAYQQSSSVKGGGIGYDGLKSASYIFRVPKAKYDQAFVELRKFGTVVFEQSNGEDVTDQYFDTEARLKSLEIQRERLLALLEKASKMEDILKIEKELQTTNYDIENLTGTLKKWDSLVEYSTLTVNISEVEEIKPVPAKEKDGFFHRIGSGFKNSALGLWEFLQDTVVFIASALPVLIPLGAIAYLLYRVMRKKFKKADKSISSKGKSAAEKLLEADKNSDSSDKSEP